MPRPGRSRRGLLALAPTSSGAPRDRSVAQGSRVDPAVSSRAHLETTPVIGPLCHLRPQGPRRNNLPFSAADPSRLAPPAAARRVRIRAMARSRRSLGEGGLLVGQMISAFSLLAPCQLLTRLGRESSGGKRVELPVWRRPSRLRQGYGGHEATAGAPKLARDRSASEGGQACVARRSLALVETASQAGWPRTAQAVRHNTICGLAAVLRLPRFLRSRASRRPKRGTHSCADPQLDNAGGGARNDQGRLRDRRRAWKPVSRASTTPPPHPTSGH